MRKSSHPRGPLLLLMAIAFVAFTGASAPLQPLVVRNAAPAGAIPAECNEGLSNVPLTPRIDMAQMPERPAERVALAPPSRELRAELEALQRALTRNDRPAFDEHLENARVIVASYPAGAEKRSAQELVSIYGDAARIWDAQFASPFFDESSGAYDVLKGYPGFEDAVRRGMLTDDRGHRYYPASESRAFLAQRAADRLERIGIRAPKPQTPTRAAAARREPPARTAAVQAPPTPAPTVSHAPRRKEPRRTTARPSRKSSPSAAEPKSTTRTESASASASPAPPPAITTHEVLTEPAPTSAPAPDTGADAAPATNIDPVTTTTAIASTSDVPLPMVDSAPATGTVSSTTAASPAPASPRRSLILPVILILVGLGVLVALFRASS